MSLLSSVHDVVFSPYGWFIVFGVVTAYIAYHRAVLPYLEQWRERSRLENSKKFDDEVDAKVSQRVLDARLKQQQEHDRVAAELKEKEEERKRAKLEEMRKKEEGESVLKHAVGSHDVKKLMPEAKKKRSPREIIDSFISSKPVIVFSKSWCPFCRKAKAALALYRLPAAHFEFVELDERTDLPGDDLQDELRQMTGSRSVPRVFIGGECIGGGDDTVRLQQEGVLDQLVASAVDAHLTKQ